MITTYPYLSNLFLPPLPLPLPPQTVLLAKAVYPYLTGNVHAQTSPSTAYSTAATVAHAKKLVSLFSEVAGIPKERVCIKIPVSAESAVACEELKKEGIQTLGTCLFSLDQALAAHQAGCTYVAPYFNGGWLRRGGMEVRMSLRRAQSSVSTSSPPPGASLPTRPPSTRCRASSSPSSTRTKRSARRR